MPEPPGDDIALSTFVDGQYISLTCTDDASEFAFLRGDEIVRDFKEQPVYNIWPFIKSQHEGQYTCKSRKGHVGTVATSDKLNLVSGEY